MKLETTLRSLIGCLESKGLKYAIVGGLAASVRGEVRFTRDIDVAILAQDDEEAEASILYLQQAGYKLFATIEQDETRRLSTARLRGANGVVCDLIFAASGIEREVVLGGTPIEILPSVTINTASSEALVAMKVLSAGPERPRDLGDIKALVEHSAKFDNDKVLALLDKIQTRGYARGQNMVQKWEQLAQKLSL